MEGNCKRIMKKIKPKLFKLKNLRRQTNITKKNDY